MAYNTQDINITLDYIDPQSIIGTYIPENDVNTDLISKFRHILAYTVIYFVTYKFHMDNILETRWYID